MMHRYRHAGMKLQQLLRMEPTEIVFRGRQEIAKRLERIGVIGNLDSLSGLDKLSPGIGPDGIFDQAREDNFRAARAFFDRFWETASSRFFEGPVSTHTPTILENRMPDVRKQVIARAGDIAQGYFDLLGYSRLFFGNPVDWHLDAVSGRQAPYVHWSRIDPLDPEMVGDSKVIWELNRHQWLLDLGQAYRFTADERYGEIFSARLRAWMQSNLPGRGINWASSLEVALRMISWCWALFLFRGSKAVSPRLFVDMLEWIRAQALHVERYLSYYFSPNTHLTGEALGLFYVGVLFPELGEAKRWRTLGRRILVEQIGRQVLPDGVYFEQSTCYQRYTVEIYLHFLILAARNGVAVPAAVGERVQWMLDFLLTIRHPDGSMPQIGDADGGTLLPLVRRAPDDFRGVFAIAATFFKRPDYAWAAGDATPEVLWLLGPEGRQAFDALQPAPPPATACSRLFSSGGYAVMRSGWGQHAHQLIFDAGPLGCPVSGGHGHADLLGIQCACFGEPYLIDTGTYGYTADARWRDYFRSTAAHSTVMVDGLNQAAPDGPFKWRQRPRARLRRWVSTETFDLADADHNAYHGLPDPVTHRRRVFFAKPRYWVLVDDLDGKAEHRIDMRFQFAPMRVILCPNGWVLARRPGTERRECRLLVFATAPLKAELIEGGLDSIQGWAAPDYGRREPAPMLTYSSVTRLPLRIVSLLFPADSPLALPPVVAASRDHRRIDLVFAHGLETLHIGEQDIVVERAT
jgi:hypothetical protein